MKLNILSKIPSFFLRLLNSLKKKITNIIVIINPKRDVNIEQNGIKNADSNVKDSDIKLTSKTIDLKEVKVIGRDDFNKEIHKKFNIEERHILVLYGQGGIGKTICSKYYAYTNKNYYKLILYMDFNENIKTTFATKCNFTENGFSRLSYEEKYIKIKEYLESLKEKCLILIDINDEEFNDFDINDIPENDNIKVLFATRCEDLCNATKIVVPKLKYEYLKQIFINNSEEINDNEDLEKLLVKILGSNTMVITLAAKTKKYAHKTIKELKEDFENDILLKKVNEKFMHEGKNEKITTHILTLFSIAKLTEENKDMLRYLTLIEYSGIEISKIMEWLNLKNYNILNEIKRKGWINISKEKDKKGNEEEIISLHPIISDSIFLQAQPNSKNCKKLLNGIFKKENNYNDFYKKSYLIEFLEFIIHRIGNEETIEIADIYHLLGGIKSDTTFDFDKCIYYGEKALNIYKKLLDEKNLKVCSAYLRVGTFYDNIGKYERAIDYFTTAFTIRKEILCLKEYPNISDIYFNLGYTSDNMKNIKQAIQYYEEALKVYDEDYEKTSSARILNNLGCIYNEIEDYEKSIKTIKSALEIYEEYFGTTHPDIATSYNNLANTYFKMGEKKKALEIFELSLNIYKNILEESLYKSKLYKDEIKKYEILMSKDIDISKLYTAYFTKNIRQKNPNLMIFFANIDKIFKYVEENLI